MTYSDAYKAQYLKSYGRSYSPARPDFSRCAASVPGEGGWWPGQCSRKPNHGPEGAWCKQHDPIAVEAKRKARQADWDAEWLKKKRTREFQSDCIAAIRSIAAGHNDPRGLAQSIIDKLEAPE